MPEVLSETPISMRARRALEYENHGLVEELMETLDLSAVRAYDLFHEMKLYLLLCMLHKGEKLPVPPEIDKILHLFLERPEFKAFCEECIAGTIEHIPSGEPMGAADLERTLERAHIRYTQHFDQRLWSAGLPACACVFRPS